MERGRVEITTFTQEPQTQLTAERSGVPPIIRTGIGGFDGGDELPPAFRNAFQGDDQPKGLTDTEIDVTIMLAIDKAEAEDPYVFAELHDEMYKKYPDLFETGEKPSRQQTANFITQARARGLIRERNPIKRTLNRVKDIFVR